MQKKIAKKPFKLVSFILFIPIPHGHLCPVVHSSSRKWVLPLEQRLSSAGGTRAAAPQAAPMIGWFSASLVLGSGPVLDLSAPHSSHVSDMEVGLWPVLSPGWNDTHGTGAAWPCCPLGAPLVQQSPTSLFIYNFTGSNTVLKSE